MTTIKIPYLVRKPSGWYWSPGRSLREAGYKTVALGTDATRAAARAIELNAEVQRAKTQRNAAIPGTVDYVFGKYLESDRFAMRAAATRREYKRLLKVLQDLPVKQRRLGDFQARSVKPKHADKIHAKLWKRSGLASANAAARVARLVWKWAIRQEHIKDMTPDQNPWLKMQLPGTGQREQQWEPEQVALFIAKAQEKGWRSIARAARIAYDGGAPEGDILGRWHKRKNGTEEWRDGFYWTDYRDGVLLKKRNKTGAPILIPVTEYPELHAMLEADRKPIGAMIECETTKRPWKPDHFRHVVREIMREAGLPDDLQFRDLRATASTELTDADAGPMQVNTHIGLKTLQMNRRYSRRTVKQAAIAAKKRVAMRTESGQKSENQSETESESPVSKSR